MGGLSWELPQKTVVMTTGGRGGGAECKHDANNILIAPCDIHWS